ncbi:hypothetical protein MWI14_003872 [Salmonella enterica subsp. diarizonae]|uniref:hypothetical protein n=1 Tax=Salmonella enterica TaxID=28901 RepID=UPI000D3D54A7|nr:hypothetical protein [Salmonella enterica]EHL1812248.1 hypothetical protein [Salmonella enterica subsp. diarizonae]HCA3617295.1 hypothetical protein [Salmonella enterica subsp. diarizonae serovar 61:i:z]EAN9586378.1 hypothetical protein [Salmonella enterica]EAO9968148.1 hypothetical protein [Salmonella enterica]EAR9443657.1 hypothetical protein [Salmonella enterica]
MRKFALRISLYYGDTLTRTLYDSQVFICQNAAQQYAERQTSERQPGKFTRHFEVTELTPQIVNEIRHEYGWNSPVTSYHVLPDNRKGVSNAQ